MMRVAPLLGGILGAVQWNALYTFFMFVYPVDALVGWNLNWNPTVLYLLTTVLGALSGVLFTRLVMEFDFKRWRLCFPASQIGFMLFEWLYAALIGGVMASLLVPMAMAHGFNRWYWYLSGVDKWLLVALECEVAWLPLLLLSRLCLLRPQSDAP